MSGITSTWSLKTEKFPSLTRKKDISQTANQIPETVILYKENLLEMSKNITAKYWSVSIFSPLLPRLRDKKKR